MDIKKRIKTIDELRENLLKEREWLQSQCNHKHYRVGLYSYSPGVNCIRMLCSNCSKVLGEASKEEIKQFTEEKNDGQGKKIYKS